MLSREDNEMLTRVGRGTPGGELLRRYWHPVAGSGELSDEKPIKKVRILGEDLVVYRDASGNYGLVAERCPHRHASLAYGRVEADGIRCAYHGWKFNAEGACLEAPAESKESNFCAAIRHTAYPVRRLGGLLFGYLGPLPAPALPHWDVLAWEHGRRWVQRHSELNCNWLQCMENSVDPSHLYWLHGTTAHLAKEMDAYEESHDFIVFEHGIMKRRTTPNRTRTGVQVDQHPLLFPNTLRHVLKSKQNGRIRHNLQIRVPVDDTHTQVFMVLFEASDDARTPADADLPCTFVNYRDENGDYRMEMVLVQDAMAWETQGPILDRTQERLGSGDKGVVIFRRLLKEQIEAVAKGLSPMGTAAAGREPLIELDVINERIGLAMPERQGAA